MRKYAWYQIWLALILILFSLSCEKDFATEPITISITKMKGDAQTGAPGDTLSIPLTVLVTKSDGKSVPEQWLEFQIVKGDASLIDTLVVTDNVGIAETQLILGREEGNVQIEARLYNTDIKTLFEALIEKPSFTISGTITGADSVTVTLSGDATVTQIVNDGGYYSFSVEHDGSYTVTPSKDYYVFTPKSLTLIKVKLNQAQNFMAESVSIEMVSIPGGSFRMGDIQGDGYSKEHPVHDVVLSGFEMSTYEVTQGQYQSVMGSNPSNYKSGDNYPVEKVLWYDAVKFCNALSDAADLDRCYDESSWSCDFSKNGFRLPTEAEWEYACRAGSETKFFTGNIISSDGKESTDLDIAGWYDINSGQKTHPIGEKIPNAWGLYDMHGNVLEWCNDWYDSAYYSNSPLTNPTGPSVGSHRVARGGGWTNDAVHCRSAYRFDIDPTGAGYFFGFRVVRRP